MELGTLLLLVAFAYSVGVFADDLLPGRRPQQPWRTAAYPFTAMALGETLMAPLPDLAPKFGGIHPFVALIAAVIGVLLDWLITSYRRPRAVATFEAGPLPAHQ
jgi:hypothetical protein